MASGMFSLSGVASGLDTHAIIDQLMEVERMPIRRLEQRQDNLRKTDQAWGQLASKLSSLRTQLDSVSRQGSLQRQFAVSSNNEDVIQVRSIDGGQPLESVTALTVQQLATHGQKASGTFDSPDLEIGAGTFEIQVGNQTVQVETTENATMRDLVQKINNADSGANATILKTGDGSYRLVLTSRNTGAANNITITQSHPGFTPAIADFDVTQEAQDAIVHYGGVAVHRAENVIDDLIEGVELTLRQPSESAVTIEVAQDLDATIEQISGVVSAFNEVLSTIDQLGRTSQNPELRGPLAGDNTLRAIAAQLRNQIASGIQHGDDVIPTSELGIQLTRSGGVTLDESRLREALEDDFDGVTQLLSRSASIDSPHGTAPFMGSQAVAGSYDVEVTQAATRAATASSEYVSPGSDTVLTITAGNQNVDVTVQAGSTLSEAVQAINSQLQEAGIARMQAVEDGGDIHFAATRWGSAGNFEVSGTDGWLSTSLDGSYEGLNVEGTIGGEPATGSGRVLTGVGDAAGISLTVTATADDLDGGSLTVGTIEATGGLGPALTGIVRAFEGRDGRVAGTRDRVNAQIDRISDQMQRFEDRLEVRRRMLVRQFTGMERALAQLQGQGDWLAGQIAGMQTQAGIRR